MSISIVKDAAEGFSEAPIFFNENSCGQRMMVVGWTDILRPVRISDTSR